MTENNIIKAFSSEGIVLKKNSKDLSAFTMQGVKPKSYKEVGKGCIVNIYFFYSIEQKSIALKEFSEIMKRINMADMMYIPYLNRRAFDIDNVIIMAAYDNVNKEEYNNKIEKILGKLKQH